MVVSFECEDRRLVAHIDLPLFALLVHGLILNEVSACSLLGGSYYRRLQRRLKEQKKKTYLLWQFFFHRLSFWHFNVTLDDNLFLTEHYPSLIPSALRHFVCFWSTHVKTDYPGCMLMPNRKRSSYKTHVTETSEGKHYTCNILNTAVRVALTHKVNGQRCKMTSADTTTETSIFSHQMLTNKSNNF